MGDRLSPGGGIPQAMGLGRLDTQQVAAARHAIIRHAESPAREQYRGWSSRREKTQQGGTCPRRNRGFLSDRGSSGLRSVLVSSVLGVAIECRSVGVLDELFQLLTEVQSSVVAAGSLMVRDPPEQHHVGVVPDAGCSTHPMALNTPLILSFATPVSM